MLQSEDFIKKCKEYIYYHCDMKYGCYKLDNDLKEQGICLVWYCKTIQNHKALFYQKDYNIYVECTYNGDKEELYFDVYKKQDKYIFGKEYN